MAVILGTTFNIYAQTAGVGSFNSDLSLVQAAAPDSIVQVVADSQRLTLLSPGQIPRSGTFWWILPSGTAVPAPCPPQDFLTAPIYQLGDQWLVDETGGVVPLNTRRFGMQTQIAGSAAVSGLEIEADTVLNLILRVQSTAANQQMRMMGMNDSSGPMPGGDGGGGGDDTNGVGFYGITYIMPTNGLWLQMAGITNGLAYVDLHDVPHLDSVYEIFSRTDLSAPSWNIETEVFPPETNQNMITFTVPEWGRTNLFFWAQDWTGVTENGNTTPDWWLYYYFGTVDLSDTNLDANGNSLLSDYQGGTDPNIIQFMIESTNDYIVNTTTASVQLNVTAGVPYYYALFVNGTTTTNWLPFTTTNLIVNIGPTDGVYDVVVGLRGLPANATQTWDDYPITLDRVAPVVKISNPALVGGSATVIKPYLQLQGLANEQLGSLSYAISNATGLFTNQPGYVTDQGFDTVKFDFTTNYFQCYDVPLATNDNFITLRATDRAGNTTTTNFDVILDYTTATNPPAVSVFWPQDGASISGDSLTLRGTMSDETGTVAAQVVDGDGNTNTMNGLVERDGTYWIEDLPLGAGDNTVTVTATDAAGNMTTTNLTVSQSDVTLTIDSTPTGDDLYQPTGRVFGTVTPGYNVSINGMPATVYDDYGNWEADNVPIYGMGTATFDAVATTPEQENQSRMRTMNSSSTTPPANLSLEVGKDPIVKVTTYQDTKSAIGRNNSTIETIISSTGAKTYNANYQTNSAGQWFYGYKGTVTNTYFVAGADPYDDVEIERHYDWSSTNTSVCYEQDTDNGTTNPATAVPIGTTAIYGYPVTDEMDEDAYDPPDGGNPAHYSVTHYFANNVQWNFVNSEGRQVHMEVNARTTTKLFTGGKAQINRRNLIQLQCDGTEYGRPSVGVGIYPYPWAYLQRTPLDKSRMRALGQWVGADGNLWVSLPDNAAMDLKLCAQARHYYAWATPIKHRLFITANGAVLNRDRVMPGANHAIGEKINLSPIFVPELPYGTQASTVLWALQGTYINAFTVWLVGASVTNNTSPYDNAEGQYDSALGLTDFRVDTDRLQQENTFAWWQTGSTSGFEPKKISLGMDLTFANGQKAAVTAEGLIGMHQPTVEWDATYYRPGVVKGYLPIYKVPKVGIGDYMDSITTPSIYGFQFAAKSQSLLPGRFGMTQLIIRNSSIANLDSWTDWRLDNTFPYKLKGEIYGNLHPPYLASYLDSDMPSVYLSTTDSFKQFYMFRPTDNDNNPSTGSIWVTLGTASWAWHGSVYLDLDGNDWSWSDTPSFTSSQSIIPSTKLPEWTHVKSNIGGDQ